jgi:hypothetical protein
MSTVFKGRFHSLAIRETPSNTSLKLVKLDSSRYSCGKEYFENSGRWLPDSKAASNATLVVHNNWIVSFEAKVYRFKEHLMWTRDTGRLYYDCISMCYPGATLRCQLSVGYCKGQMSVKYRTSTLLIIAHVIAAYIGDFFVKKYKVKDSLCLHDLISGIIGLNKRLYD